ncbi:hypothetical protein [Nonlabens xiamenensis]|uniref:hypothetical protein n=1 Tax=Nonlabens xiamenensis TaxID=2341043 RepID=UPI000F60CDC3|nr:hypothetical protein [Nonlabens xiamenensis]
MDIRKLAKKSFLIGSIVTVLLAITPYFFHLYEVIPNNAWEIGFLQNIVASYSGNANVAFWVIFNKLIPFFLMLTWFLTCRHWWYHIILVPTCMFGFQLFSAINPDIEILDKNELYFVVPVVIFALSLTYVARIKVFDLIHGIDLTEIEGESKKQKDRWFS